MAGENLHKKLCRTGWALAMVGLFGFPVAGPIFGAPNELVLKKGDVYPRLFDRARCEGLKSATLNNRLVAVKEGERGCRLLAFEEGVTRMSDGATDWRITVLSEADHEMYVRFQKAFHFVDRVEIEPIRFDSDEDSALGDHEKDRASGRREQQWIIRGELKSVSDVRQFLRVMKRFPVRDEVTLEKTLQEKVFSATDQFNEEEVERGSSFRARLQGKSVVFEGKGSEAERRRVSARFSEICPIANGSVAPAEILPTFARLVLRFVEVFNQNLSNVGIETAPAIEMNTFFQTGTNVRDSLITEGRLDSMINLLSSRGMGEVAFSQALTCRNREPVFFTSGGEVPIETKSRYSSAVKYKPYGLKLKIRCEMRPARRIRMGLLFQLSAIDKTAAPSGSQNPAFTNKEYQNTVEIPFGMALVLFSTEMALQMKGNGGIPLLSAIPLFGGLFKTESELFNAKKGFLVLTPEVIE